jgi:DNA-binding transcriptional regulator YiaG
MIDTKEVRNKIGLTQQAMADLMGVHKQTWIKWERLERKPDMAAVRLMAVLSWLYDKKLLKRLIAHLHKPV